MMLTCRYLHRCLRSSTQIQLYLSECKLSAETLDAASACWPCARAIRVRGTQFPIADTNVALRIARFWYLQLVGVGPEFMRTLFLNLASTGIKPEFRSVAIAGTLISLPAYDFSACINLTTIQLGGIIFTPEDVRILCTCTHLDRLVLFSCGNVDTLLLREQAIAKRLRALSITNPRKFSLFETNFTRFVHLRTVYVDNVSLFEHQWISLGTLPSLEALTTLNAEKPYWFACEALSKSKSLRFVTIDAGVGYQKIRPEDGPLLFACTTMQRLQIAGFLNDWGWWTFTRPSGYKGPFKTVNIYT